MIISRTPYRLSFFGGGLDYPEWYKDHDGAVLATSINKYCYISLNRMYPFGSKYRVCWRMVEDCNNISDIQHPSVRGCLQFMGIEDSLEIRHHGELPARIGLGSSSAFTVGLLNALYALKGIHPSDWQLAKDAIKVEQEILKETIGIQDQIICAMGGFKYIEIAYKANKLVTLSHIHSISSERLEHFLMLFFTGFTKPEWNIAEEQVKEIPNKAKEYMALYEMAGHSRNLLRSDRLKEFGKLLNEEWEIKRSLSRHISNSIIDQIYESGMRAGAIGGKLCGAGGGGFMLFFAEPETQPKIQEVLKNLVQVPFKFERAGSQIVYNV